VTFKRLKIPAQKQNGMGPISLIFKKKMLVWKKQKMKMEPKIVNEAEKSVFINFEKNFNLDFLSQ